VSSGSDEKAFQPLAVASTDGTGILRTWWEGATRVVPGVAFMAAIALAATILRRLPVIALFSPMILAILIGTTYHNVVGTPSWAKAGIKFCLRRILRLGIILLGLQLTLSQIMEVGGRGLGIIVTTMVCTFLFTGWAGRMLGVDRKLAQLIAGGTSICGASAVIATNTVTGASDEDVSYAVACVTVFGSIAMFAYPLLPRILNLDPHAFGLWTGASVHEIAQVVAAAFQDGEEAGKFGTIAKLSRVILLAPMTIILGVQAARQARALPVVHGSAGQKPPLPWFVAGFLLLTILNSVVAVPVEFKPAIVGFTAFLLSTALAAMGMETDLRKLTARGFRPALLGAAAFAFIATVSLGLIKIFM
jgi:uncharacterized integral membrane protein (TIGR00698 family)